MFALIIGIIFSFVLTLTLLPISIKIADANKWFVPITYRRIHTTNVSALGGIAIFFSSTISFILFSDIVNYTSYKYILSSGILLFFIGIKDDLYDIKPILKLAGQFIAVSILVGFAGVQIEFIQHFINGDLGLFADILLSIIIMLTIINAYNLIDGIDMLAAIIGTVILGSLGIWFFLVNQVDYSLALLSIVSSLMAFMLFNYSPAKIFMGDTGTLTIGLIMSFSLIKFDEINSMIDSQYSINSAPAQSYAAISLIVFDLLRVVFIRIKRKKSIFIADRNHIHHHLLKLGLSANKISFLLSSIILLQIIGSLFLDHFSYGSIFIIVSNTIFLTIFYAVLFQFLKSNSRIITDSKT